MGKLCFMCSLNFTDMSFLVQPKRRSARLSAVSICIYLLIFYHLGWGQLKINCWGFSPTTEKGTLRVLQYLKFPFHVSIPWTSPHPRLLPWDTTSVIMHIPSGHKYPELGNIDSKIDLFPVGLLRTNARSSVSHLLSPLPGNLPIDFSQGQQIILKSYQHNPHEKIKINIYFWCSPDLFLVFFAETCSTQTGAKAQKGST